MAHHDLRAVCAVPLTLTLALALALALALTLALTLTLALALALALTLGELLLSHAPATDAAGMSFSRLRPSSSLPG